MRWPIRSCCGRYWNERASKLPNRHARLLGRHLPWQMQSRTAWRQRGVSQNKAAMLLKSLLRSERTGEQIAESARKASRATSAVADAIEDGVEAARRVAKQGGDAAEEFIDRSEERRVGKE